MAIREGDLVTGREHVEENLRPIYRVDGLVKDALGRVYVALLDARSGQGVGCKTIGQVKLAAFDLDGRPRLPCGHFTHEDGGPSDYGAKCRRYL